MPFTMFLYADSITTKFLFSENWYSNDKNFKTSTQRLKDMLETILSTKPRTAAQFIWNDNCPHSGWQAVFGATAFM